MPRLSIVIPALGHHDLLESGLVSVLEHRPADSEVLVVLNHAYHDPYDLEGEIHFIHAPAQAGLIECLNRGYQASSGGAIHFLGCGFEVCPGWTDGPLARLADAKLGAVAPLLVQPGSQQRITVGVDYHRGGRPELLRLETDEPANDIEPLGPIGLASFYNAAALEVLDEVFSAEVGPEWPDVDLALRLRAAGYGVRLEPTSRIVGDPGRFITTPGSLARARFAERLYWRHAATLGRVGSLVSHARLVIGETAKGIPRLRCFGGIVGRALGCFDSLGTSGTATAALACDPTKSALHRLDPSHDVSGPTAGPPLPTNQRRKASA